MIPAEAAFATLYTTQRGAIFGFVLRLVANPAEAEDVTQEAFLHAWAAWSRFPPDGNGRAWIFQIARHVALDHLRRRRTVPWSPDLPEPAAPDDPLAEVCAREGCARLRTALAALPPRHRRAVIGALGGQSERAQAAALGLSAAAAKSLLHRARMRLRRTLELDSARAAGVQSAGKSRAA